MAEVGTPAFYSHRPASLPGGPPALPSRFSKHQFTQPQLLAVLCLMRYEFLLSRIARCGPWNDCANLSAVVEAASEQTRIGLVLADAEFNSQRNHTYIRQQLGDRV